MSIILTFLDYMMKYILILFSKKKVEERERMKENRKPTNDKVVIPRLLASSTNIISSRYLGGVRLIAL